MATYVILGLIAALPVVLILFFRSDAAIVFLSLCVGSLLVAYVGNDAADVVANEIYHNNISSITNVTLLLLPAVLSLLMLRKSASPSKLPLTLVTAVAVGLVTAILVVPLLPGGVQADITGSAVWQDSLSFQKWVVAGGSAVALVSLWLTRHTKRGHGKKHK